MRKNIYLVVLLFFFSCNAPKKDVIILTGFQIENELPYMKYPLRVEIEDSLMVILDLIPEEYAYHVVSYPELVYQYSVGKRGNGPGEITLTTPFQIKNNKLMILDGNRPTLYTFSLSQREDQDPDIITLELPTTLDFVSVDDSTILVGDYLGENRFIKIQSSSKTGMFEITQIDKNYTSSLAPYWRSYMDYHPGLKSLVMATQFGDVLEKYDLENNTMNYVIGDDGGIPVQQTEIQGYADIKWIGDEIYALYQGSFKDGSKMPNDRKERGAAILRKYDKNLKHLRTFKLDKKITGFTVDRKNNLLIGVTPNSDNVLIYYNLEP